LNKTVLSKSLVNNRGLIKLQPLQSTQTVC
jgi:hypothetical protein